MNEHHMIPANIAHRSADHRPVGSRSDLAKRHDTETSDQ
ncbi:MAG: hypothetical protein JWM34_4025 [Ilumatobacteraceae bacterium]|nr:hypothetical protein [Ilumatobacteraceae bacterium]